MQLLQADHSVSKPPYAAVNSKEKGSRKRNINLTLDYIGLGQKHSLVGLSNLLRRDINRIDKCANKQGCLRNQSVSESPHHLETRIISVTLLGNGNHPSVFSLGFFLYFTNTYPYSLMERGSPSVKSRAQENNTETWPELEPAHADSEP